MMNRNFKICATLTWAIGTLASTWSPVTWAAPKAAAAAPAPAPVAPPSEDATAIEQIKNRYWAQGNENEMGVVQNRLYP